MHTAPTEDRVPLELIEKLGIASPDDAAAALAGALSLMEAHDVRKFVAFTAYYGLRGFTAASEKEVGEGLGIGKVPATALIESVEQLIDEEMRRIRCERLFPNAYSSWPIEDFFTVSRALAARVPFASAVRIRTFVRREKRDIPNVRDLCRMTENGLLQFPGIGVAMVHSMKAMLASVHLRLATH